MARVKPVIGEQYVIVQGDTLWDIATVVYGSGWKYQLIWDANKSNLRSGDPNLIYPGERLWIPPDPDRQETASDAKSAKARAVDAPEGALSVFLRGEAYRPVSATVTRTFDTCADGWAMTFRDNLQDEDWVKRRGVFRPYGYPPAEVFLAGVSLGESVGYDTKLEGSSSTGMVTMEGYSPSVDMVDSVAEPPYEANNISIEEWIKRLIKPFGLTFSTSEVDQSAWAEANAKKIKRIRIGKEEKVFEHVSKQLRQRGFVLSNGETTNLAVRSVPAVKIQVEEFVDTPGDGSVPVLKTVAKFKGRDRYRITVVTGKGPRRNFRTTYQDPSVPRNRRELTQVSSAEEGDASTAAESRARKRIADALTFDIPCRDWFSREGKLYAPGQFVLYKSERLFLKKGVVLLVRKVQYILEGKERRAVLGVIPPTVYSKGQVEDPWSSEK